MRAKLQWNAFGIALIVIGGVSLLASLMTGREPVSSDGKNPPGLSGKASGSAETAICKVLSVYDGDTLGCDLDGNGKIARPSEEIRLLGIDSPEMHYSRKNPTYHSAHPVDESFAPEASRWLESHALHKTLLLEFDAHRTDRYGRTLAYVYPVPADNASSPDSKSPLSGKLSLNAGELEAGYAKTLFIGNNRKHEAEFQRLEASARTAKKGLWGAQSKF